MSMTRITLTSGRTVALSELRLSATYGGMLEGYPFRMLNDRRIAAAVRGAELDFPQRPVHLVEPVRELPDTPAPAFGPVEMLPFVTCVGALSSEPVDPGHDPALFRSVLTVVWFQAAAAVPEGEDADPGLRSVPWDEVARDVEL
jgi:hypothetical protein